MIIAKEQEELELNEQIFDKLFQFINNENLSNPYRIKSKDGKVITASTHTYEYVDDAEAAAKLITNNLQSLTNI